MSALVVVCGLPGVGKTTVAETAAERLDARLLRTDVVRKELVGEPTYDAAETRRVYTALLERAEATLEGGASVVLDGTFRRASQRRRAKAAAADHDAAFELLCVECPTERVRERIARREGDASDADFAIHERLRESFEPITIPHTTVDNAGPLERTRDQMPVEPVTR